MGPSALPFLSFAAPLARPDCAARQPHGGEGSDLPARRRSCGSPIDLNDFDSVGLQVAGEPGAVAAGALDSDERHGAEAAEHS